jgi:hypothetical protein
MNIGEPHFIVMYISFVIVNAVVIPSSLLTIFPSAPSMDPCPIGYNFIFPGIPAINFAWYISDGWPFTSFSLSGHVAL